ncbi:MAG: hypothetical protein M3277_02980 [Actinomycetota bacterium]|nr:hypothetical protein [Actinomycetota bacterium]
MRTASEVLRYINVAAFVLLALVTYLSWRRSKHPGALWVFLTFLVLGSAAIAGIVFPDDSESQTWLIANKVLIAVVLLFPYFLYRVSASFVATSRTWDVVATGVTTLVIGWTMGIDAFPSSGEPQPTGFRVYVAAILLQWTFLSVVVAVRFWRAGRVQRSAAAARMKMLAIASIVLSIVLIISGGGGEAADRPIFELVTRSLTLLSVLAFFLAFAPPRWLRQIWTKPIQDRLRLATIDLMSSSSEEQVTETLLPSALEIVSGEAIAVVDVRGQILASQGFERSHLEEARLLLAAATAEEHERLRPDLVSLKFDFGWLLVKTGPYTTYFGREEVELLGALGALANLAIERVRAEDIKMELAAAQIRRQQALEINDNVVQGLAVAKYAFELNQPERAKAAVDGTLEAARKIISDLLEELGDEAQMLPGSLTRDAAASGYVEGPASEAG